MLSPCLIFKRISLAVELGIGTEDEGQKEEEEAGGYSNIPRERRGDLDKGSSAGGRKDQIRDVF